jgi:hypothetical protein
MRSDEGSCCVVINCSMTIDILVDLERHRERQRRKAKGMGLMEKMKKLTISSVQISFQIRDSG